jgi:hypothetical protein
MTKLFTTLLLLKIISSTMPAVAQIGAGSLSENFDVKCVTSTEPGGAWFIYNPPSTGASLGRWNCTSTNGKGGTPAVQCSGYYSGAYHLDTSYLFTPPLNLAASTGNVYLQFDSKTQNIHLGGRLEVLTAPFGDTSYQSYSDSNITYKLSPVISNLDSSNWVTHQVDITDYKTLGNFYVIFRYTSTNTTGTIWYIDNINTTSTRLNNNVGKIIEERLPVSVVSSSADEIIFSLTAPAPGLYDLRLYDIVGRERYSQQLKVEPGNHNYTIKPGGMRPGMNILKISNEDQVGITKIMIP